MKIIYFKILIFILLMLPTHIYGQQNMLRGIVRDKIDVMVGVHVALIDAEKRVITGTGTNINGEYFINVPAGIKEIEFSFIGYKVQRVEYTGQPRINIMLEEDITTLDEFVITAQTVDKNSMGIPTKDLGIARQKIDLDEFQDMPVTSVEDML
ncbi:MAG: carboxypeptidase-like regulatory domain-containing protein [Odoribacter sp.]|nr:carboxypeptidase-like regulatory domain-containing protein [Odoribacter sp.]